MCYKPTMHFLTLFGKRCFLLWPGHNHALLRAPQKKACVLRKFIGTFASNTKVKKASMLSILTAKKKKKEEEGWGGEDRRPKVSKRLQIQNFLYWVPFFPQPWHCSSVSSSKFAWSDRFECYCLSWQFQRKGKSSDRQQEDSLSVAI